MSTNQSQTCISTSDARLVVAVAKARNQEVIGRVVDESISRAAELREQREARDQVRRREERRAQRIEEAERAEQEEAARTVQRQREEQTRLQAADAVRRERARAELASEHDDGPPAGPFDRMA